MTNQRTLRVDVLESAQDILLLADLPGVRADGLKLDVDAGELTIRASTPEDHVFGAQSWQRSFTLPRSVRLDDVKAELRDGVLRVTLPRAGAAVRREIPIASA